MTNLHCERCGQLGAQYRSDVGEPLCNICYANIRHHEREQRRIKRALLK
jgi:hypothetical protein